MISLTEDQYRELGQKARAVWDSHNYTDRSRVQLLLFDNGDLLIAEWGLNPILSRKSEEYALLKNGEWTLRNNIEGTITHHMQDGKLDESSKHFLEWARRLRRLDSAPGAFHYELGKLLLSRRRPGQPPSMLIGYLRLIGQKHPEASEIVDRMKELLNPYATPGINRPIIKESKEYTSLYNQLCVLVDSS